jgi:hypothetical protein
MPPSQTKYYKASTATLLGFYLISGERPVRIIAGRAIPNRAPSLRPLSPKRGRGEEENQGVYYLLLRQFYLQQLSRLGFAFFRFADDGDVQ